MTCLTREPPKKCNLPECPNLVRRKKTGEPQRYCSLKCNRKALALGLRVKPTSELLGPEEPTLGMTAEQALARKERLVVELLRDGVPPTSIRERFNESGVDVKRIAERYGIPLSRCAIARLAYGGPVL